MEWTPAQGRRQTQQLSLLLFISGSERGDPGLEPVGKPEDGQVPPSTAHRAGSRNESGGSE
jgi:hypothetical protein